MKSELYTVLQRVHKESLAIQSDFAREFAQAIAALASLGFITTRLGQSFGRHWRLTPEGHFFLKDEGLL